MKFSEILKNDISNGTIVKNDSGTPAQGATGKKKKFSDILKEDVENGNISAVNTSDAQTTATPPPAPAEPKKPDVTNNQSAVVSKMLDLREDAAEEREKLLSYDADEGKKKIERMEGALSDLYKRQDAVDAKIASSGGQKTVNDNASVTTLPDERKALLNEKISMKLKDTEKSITDSLVNEKNTFEAATALNPPILKKYNIDPSTFDMNAYLEWLDENDMHLERNEEGYMSPYANGSVDDETLQDAEALYELVKNNERKKRSDTDMGALWSGVGGFGDGISFGGLTALGDYQAKKAYEKAGLNPADYVSPSVSNEKTMVEHPVANIVGNTVGSVIMLRGLGEAVGAITKGIKWFSKMPTWIQNAINSGITFAVAGGAETGFDGGELKDVLMRAGADFVGGAAGSTASGIVGDLGEKTIFKLAGKEINILGKKIVFDKTLQHKIIPEIIRGGLSSAAFAGGKVGSTYFLYPEDSRPGAEDIARDLTVAFAFGAVSSGINTMKTSAQNKKYLDDLYQKMAADYKNLAAANVNGKNDISGMRKFAENVISYSDAMEAYLTGKTYNAKIDGKTYSFNPNKIRLVGQDKYVKSIISELQLIRSNANAILSGVGSPSTAVTPSAHGDSSVGGGVSPTPTSGSTIQVPTASVSNTPANLPNSAIEATSPKSPTEAPSGATAAKLDAPVNYTGVLSAINSTLKPEVTSNADLVGKYTSKFGDDVADGLAKKIASVFETSGNIGNFEGLFTDNGQAIYKALSSIQKNDIRYSVDESFSETYDLWVERGRPNREVMIVGTTSEALKSIGVRNQKITWDTSKINNSLKKHAYLSDELMKSIPNLLETPVIVMQSKQSDSRITLFGEVYDADGLPVMAVLELLPLNRAGTIVLDEIKLVSTHSRKTSNPSDVSQTQNLIYASDILYVDPNKTRTDKWLMLNRLQLPLSITTYGPMKSITYPEGNVNTYSMQSTNNYSREETASEKSGNSLLSGSSGRDSDASTGKQTERISAYKRKLEGKTAAERKGYAKELLEKGLTEEVIDGTHKYTLVKPEGYNSDMLAIIEDAKSRGKEVGFFIGNAIRKFDGKREFKIDGIKISDSKILLRYDGEYTPQTLLVHEDAHTDWNTPDMQDIKETILGSITDAEKAELLSAGRYKAYSELYKNDPDAVWEEFVADVLAGMNDYTPDFIDVIAEYYFGEQSIDRYSPREYNSIIDAGGNAAVLNGVGMSDNGNVDIRYTFAGERANGANTSSLERAKEMSARGVDKEAVFAETGWFKGGDGKWRFEIDDSASTFFLEKLKGGSELTLSDIWHNDAAYTAYPFLKDIKIKVVAFGDSSKTRGEYDALNNRISLSDEVLDAEVMRFFADEYEGVLLHEIQHAIQFYEGFELGGTPESILEYLREQYQYWLGDNDERFKQIVASGTFQDIDEYVDNYIVKSFKAKNIKDAAFIAYRRLHGEKEAREVARRLKMSTEDRTQNYPNYKKGAIVRKNDNERTNQTIGISKAAERTPGSGFAENILADTGRGLGEGEQRGNAKSGRRSSGDTQFIPKEASFSITESDTAGLTPEDNKRDVRYSISPDISDAQSDADTEFWEEWLDMARAYGIIPKGENPVRDVAVPKKTERNRGIIEEKGTAEQADADNVSTKEVGSDAEKTKIEFNGGNTDARAGETIPDAVNAESTRGMGEEVAAGARSNTERIQRKIKEILRKSTNSRHDTGNTGRGSARLEQKETSEAFERRALNDGYRYVTFSNGKSSLAYKNAPKNEWNVNAKEAAEVLGDLGFAVVVFDGDLRSNNGSVTQITLEGATCGVGDNLTIFVSSKLDIDGLETAYHEAFHALRRSGSVKNTMLHYRMIDIISSGVDVECEAFEKFVSTIIDLYSYEVKTVSTDKFSGEITEEFYSWYIGSIYANKNIHSSDMLSYIKGFADVDNIKTQLDAMFAEVKSNTKLPKAGTTLKTAVGSQAPYGSNVTPQPMPEAPFASSSASNNIVPQDNNKVASAAEPAKSKSGVKSSRDTATESSRADRWSTDRVAENTESKSTVSISEIIEQISLEFGIPVSTGKVTDREASGIYKEKPETIRTRISNNLPTISHELGHHLDKKYNLNELSSVDSIRVIVSEGFLDQYPDDAVNSELIAEFVRRYLKNSNEANRLCPDFYNDFVRTLSKEDLAAVNRVAKQVNEYLSYDIDKRYESSVISAKKAKKMQKLPFAERWKKLYTGWVDKFHPLKQITDYVSEIKGSVLSGTKNAYVLATNSLNAHTIANYQVCEGFRDLNGNFVDDAKSLIECIGMVNSKDITTFDLYLKLKHALEVIGKGKRVFADEVLEDTDNIKKKITEIEKAHPEMVEAANNLYEFQYNMLKHFAVPSGIMTMKQVEYLHNEYPCYVPFYRFIKNKKGGMFAKSSFVNQGSPIVRQTGSGLDTLSHLESIIRNVEKIVKASTRNQTAAVIGSYADNVDGIGQFIEKVAPDMLPHTIDITALKENFANRLQEVVKSSDDFFAISGLMDDVFGDDVTDFTPVANESKKIISVMRGGERFYYQIHDDALFSAVAELSPQQVNGWIRVNNMIMQPMKLLITQNNPIFAATNALRDFGTAYKLSEINNPLTFVVRYAKALGGIITNSEDYKKYKAMGGGHSSELSANIENISKTLRRVAQKDMGKARRIAYSIFRHPVDTVASINDAVESIPRFMEFERTLKENGDLQKAIFNASDITTNFKRSGSSNTAKFVNSSIMFNNAAIQGLDKTFRTLTAKDPKQRNKTLLKFVLVALIGGLIRHFWNNEIDEEGYKNLSSYKKNNFYNFAIGDGIFISLPKERENAILDSLVERVLEALSGNEEAFYDFGGYLASQLLPPMFPDTLNPVDAVHSVGGSTIFGGLLDVGFNKDFKGTPIEGAYDKYTPSNERYTDSTTKLAYELGQTKLARDLDMSPKKIDHLISSYTGILGQINKALFPMNENRRDFSVGLRNKFVSDSNYSTDVLNRMYENQEKTEKSFNYSGTIDTAVEYEKNSVITSYISGMNKAIKALPEEEQRNGRAYLLKTLNSWNYGDTTSQSNMLSSFDNSVVSKDAIFTELPGSTLEWSVNKQKYVYQMTPQEYHKYISDYMAAIENARRHYGYDSVESCEKAKKAAKDFMSNYKKTVLKEKYLSKAVPESK